MKREMKKPNIHEEKLSEFESSFIIEPYERGFGVTVGNSLRRVLLSSLSKFAPIAIKLSVLGKLQTGRKKKEMDTIQIHARHELDVLQGIYEDVFQIILNVKELIFQIDDNLFKNQDEVIEVKIEGAKGEVKAKDLILPPGVRIVNSNNIVFTAVPNDEVVSVSLVIYIEKGRGYFKASENKQIQLETKKIDDINVISIDSNFSPVLKVSTNIEELPGYERPHEKLTLKIHTDGSITPKQAFENAGYILKSQFELISAKNVDAIEFEKKEWKEQTFSSRQPIVLEELGLDKRTLSALKKAGLRDLDDLMKKSTSDLLAINNLGEKSVAKLIEIIKQKKEQ